MKINLKSITLSICIASLGVLSLTNQSLAEIDKSQPIQVISPYSMTGGTHGLGKTIVDYLETQGWNNINGGKGFQSTGGCANMLNVVENAEGPIFWLEDTVVLNHPEEHPCYVDAVEEKDFVTQFSGWTDFICSRKELDLPPIDEATGTVRIAVDFKEYFGDEEEALLRSIAPNANIILMRYGASGGALKAIQAKEVEYTWSTLFDGPRSEYKLKCDYNTSSQSIRGTTPLRDAFPEIDFSDARIAFKGANWNWFNAKNASEELKESFAKDWTDAFEKYEPTIESMNARGYLWPTPTSNLDMSVMKNIVGSKWQE